MTHTARCDDLKKSAQVAICDRDAARADGDTDTANGANLIAIAATEIAAAECRRNCARSGKS